MSFRLLSIVSGIAISSSPCTCAEVLISQYYEGSSFNKWVELSNTDEVAVSLDGFVLTRWANASTENWKQEGAAPSGRDFLDGLSIPAKGYLLLGNTGAVLPSYAGADVSTNATPNFNGDDSVVLYDTSKGALGSTSAIADAVSFTDSGSEGANRSFYRISNSVGYDLNAGSTVLDFPGVWGEKSNADVDAALQDDPWYLQNFEETASESLSITLNPESIPENGGPGIVEVTVTRSGATDNPLSLNLVSSDTGEAVIPVPDREIPAGWESVTFPALIDAVDDQIEDGSQEVVISVSATGFSSGSAVLNVTDDNDLSPVVITEILADIPPGAAGDANSDGDTDSGDDEFVEILNKSGASLDISNWSLHDAAEQRHVFPEGTILPEGCAIVVFGGGFVDNLGGSSIFQTVSTIRLGLNNAGDTVSIYDALGELVESVTYGAEGGNDQSLVRDPDSPGGFEQHGSVAEAGGSLFSPGTRTDGSDFCPPLGELSFSLSASSMNENGGTISALLRRTGGIEDPLDVVIQITDETEALADVGGRATFQAGESSLTFSINAQDDIAEDGNQPVQIRAVAPGYSTASASFEVEDDGDGPFTIIVINEFLSDPPNPDGDSNRDGTLDFSQDEFIEFLNVSEEDFDLSDYEVHDGVGLRHVFSPGTLLAAGRAIVVFGGGEPAGSFGGSLIQTASSGFLGLNNGGDTISLKTPGGGSTLLEVTYDGGVLDQSMSRDPDGSGSFVAHSASNGGGGSLFSPGTRVDGGDFDGAVEIGVIDITSFAVDVDRQEVILEVAGMTAGEEYCFDVSLDLAFTNPWFPFELLTTDTGIEVAPGIFRFVVSDPFISQESSQYYRVRKP